MPRSEVVDGSYRLTYAPRDRVPVGDWLRGQKRFAHLFEPENADLLAYVQRRVDEDWDALLALCA